MFACLDREISRDLHLSLTSGDVTMLQGKWPSRIAQITSDPADNIFLECADAARADYLLTGNQRHFPKFWKNTKIISSREFLSVIAPRLIG